MNRSMPEECLSVLKYESESYTVVELWDLKDEALDIKLFSEIISSECKPLTQLGV